MVHLTVSPALIVTDDGEKPVLVIATSCVVVAAGGGGAGELPPLPDFGFTFMYGSR